MSKPSAPKHEAYVYAVVDLAEVEPGKRLISIEKTRRAARDKVKWHKDSATLRIRRGRLFLYER